VVLGYCWFSVFAGLADRQDGTHAKQPICQLLPPPREVRHGRRLGQNPLGWLWHQLQMSLH